MNCKIETPVEDTYILKRLAKATKMKLLDLTCSRCALCSVIINKMKVCDCEEKLTSTHSPCNYLM